VLLALSIPHLMQQVGDEYVLLVDSADSSRALSHLESYETERRLERERRAAATHAAVMPLHQGAWIGCVLYATVLLAVAWMITRGYGRLDAFDRGALEGAAVQRGEWWRAWTALTLHLDAAHIAANLAAGCWFGYLASRQLGSGIAWLLTVIGAAAANLVEGLLGPPSHSAVGASTAVFTALGVAAAYSWRMRFDVRARWAVRWAPLIAGIALLGWFGSSGEDTDLVGHAVGFVAGVLLGMTAAIPAIGRLLGRLPQWLAGAAALLSIAVAWAFALAS
jgi:rhomboid protease GluP